MSVGRSCWPCLTTWRWTLHSNIPVGSLYLLEFGNTLRITESRQVTDRRTRCRLYTWAIGWRWGLRLSQTTKSCLLLIRESPLIHSFTFHSASYLWSTTVRKYAMGNSRNKQFIPFKLYTFLSSMMNSRDILPRTWIILLFSVHTVYSPCPSVT